MTDRDRDVGRAGDQRESASANGTPPRLDGRGLILARVGWVVVTLTVVALNLIALPDTFGSHFTFTPSVLHEPHRLDLSPTLYGLLLTLENASLQLVYLALGLLLFWRRSDERMALFCAFTFVTLHALVYPLIPFLPLPEHAIVLTTRQGGLHTSGGCATIKCVRNRFGVRGARESEAAMAQEPLPETELCPVPHAHPAEIASVRGQLADDATYVALAELFGALADPSRARIVHLLMEREWCTCDIAAVVGTSESSISQHLRVLRGLHLVRARRAGKFVYYRLDDAHVALLMRVSLTHLGEPEHAADAAPAGTAATGAHGMVIEAEFEETEAR